LVLCCCVAFPSINVMVLRVVCSQGAGGHQGGAA
jgi:hypothetical protein